MKISIALCTYNGAKFLQEQLDSFTAQSRLPDELVVVDDGSKDETIEIIEAFKQSAPFVVRVLRNETRLGVVGNFEKAFAACSGDVIFPSDQDDVWLAEKLELMMQHFADPKVDLVACNATPVDVQLVSSGQDFWAAMGVSKKRMKSLHAGNAFEVLLVQGNVFAGMSMAARRSFVTSVMPVGNGWYHDGWLALAAAARNALRIEPRQLVLYRIHQNNTVGINRTPWSELLRGFFALESDVLLSTAGQLETACERFRGTIEDKHVWRLSERARHLRFRAGLPIARRERISPILSEWLSGRYNRYSWGPIAVVRDILRAS